MQWAKVTSIIARMTDLERSFCRGVPSDLLRREAVIQAKLGVLELGAQELLFAIGWVAGGSTGTKKNDVS